jgi:hypothetical protein
MSSGGNLNLGPHKYEPGGINHSITTFIPGREEFVVVIMSGWSVQTP